LNGTLAVLLSVVITAMSRSTFILPNTLLLAFFGRIPMGIDRKFNFGINLYTYSFAFSKIKFEAKKEIDKKINNINIIFLSSFSKEIFNSDYSKNTHNISNNLIRWRFIH